MMIKIVQAATLAQFYAFRDLMDEMAIWDAEETRAQGYDSAALLAEGYAGSAEELLASFTVPGCALYIAAIDDKTAGCAGFSRADDGMAELEKVYVKPPFRGLGIGPALLSKVMAAIRTSGYTGARLETANFMTAAQALYQRHGFVKVSPFRRSIGNTGDMSVFMRCDLGKSSAGKSLR